MFEFKYKIYRIDMVFYKLLLNKFLVEYKNTIVDNISEYDNILLIASK